MGLQNPDPRFESGRRLHLLPWFVPALAVLWLVLRFVVLEHSPPGFYGDEFRGALHAICIGETGESAYGERWPVFVRGAGGGFYTPPFLYFSAVWAKVFGYSIASFRAIAAFFSVLTIVALYGWVRRAAGPEIAAWSAFVAALSPWSFQFSRIAWDPPLAPAFLMLGLWAWTQPRARAGRTSRGPWRRSRCTPTRRCGSRRRWCSQPCSPSSWPADACAPVR